jgi:CRISPR-associated endonuclease/helicase Cas3
MAVPIGLVRAWLVGTEASDELRSDLLDAPSPEAVDEEGQPQRVGVAWRGTDHSILIRRPGDLRPGDTIVLPTTPAAWDAASVFGHSPAGNPRDIAEKAYCQSRGRAILRLTPARVERWPITDEVSELKKWVNGPDIDLSPRDLRNLLNLAADAFSDQSFDDASTLRVLTNAKYGLEQERYPGGVGIVLRSRRQVPNARRVALPAMDDGEDETSRIGRENPVPLDEHLEDVCRQLNLMIELLPVHDWAEALQRAAELHDWGKADERFQALLIGGDRDDAWAQPRLWAKSARMPTTFQQRRFARQRSGLPEGFRHEMLSVQLAQLASDRLPADQIQRDLVLHLIAAHHGRARPFAPVVLDDAPPEIGLGPLGIDTFLTTESRRSNPPHRLDSGIAERFWSLTRRFGWWGLAYLEAILRLADQRASQLEDDAPEDGAKAKQSAVEALA